MTRRDTAFRNELSPAKLPALPAIRIASCWRQFSAFWAIPALSTRSLPSDA
jgi:hypothetical protein